ncbi:MAG: VWA domain-containing protein [Dysgonamonadaceae bacterium]|jgi:hypothetical protein|nr:VWA domain-containing protein [Dysgonamonadaceae bacterium]
MRKILLLLIVLWFAAQATLTAQAKRYIYLWDVTLSMKGYRGVAKHPYQRELDIYNDVRDFLVNTINSIEDETTEIVVLPFQDEHLTFEPWTRQATVEGKREIIQRIENYTNEQETNTDIVGAIEYAKKNLVKSGNENTLILLTDGTQSEKLSGGNAALVELLKGWKIYAKEKNAYLLYIMLNNKAVPDKKVFETLKEEEKTQTLSVVTDFIILEPSTDNFNVKDNQGKPVEIHFESKNNAMPDLPTKMRVKVQSAANPYVNIHQTLEIGRDLRVFFRLDDEENIRNKMLEDKVVEYPVSLHIDILNQGEIQKEGKTVTISPNDIQFVLINKPVKTLKIHYVE